MADRTIAAIPDPTQPGRTARRRAGGMACGVLVGSAAERAPGRSPCGLPIVKQQGFEPSLPHSH